MLTRDDPEGGDEEEYRAVGDRAPVVAGARFAPEGVGDRLRFGRRARFHVPYQSAAVVIANQKRLVTR